MDFYEIADSIRKRVSFMGIYQCKDQAEINSKKIVSLKDQVKIIT